LDCLPSLLLLLLLLLLLRLGMGMLLGRSASRPGL
jgi:hypothetical protein